MKSAGEIEAECVLGGLMVAVLANRKARGLAGPDQLRTLIGLGFTTATALTFTREQAKDVIERMVGE